MATKILADCLERRGRRDRRRAARVLSGMRRLLALVFVAAAAAPAPAQPAAALDSAALRRSIDELRHVVGRWQVQTEFLNPDGRVARSVAATYRFEWALRDRILVGVTEMPELNSASGILFYVAPNRSAIEMVSVGPDGFLWTMTGAIGGNERRTQPFRTQGGGESRLRFTRYNVSADAFESRMEYTEDDGKTWLPGNHQVFRRVS